MSRETQTHLQPSCPPAALVPPVTTAPRATRRRPRRDRSHHHPRVGRSFAGPWEWDCVCGGHAGRRGERSWHQALIEALAHSAQLAA